ncbi:sigma-54 interaction domain-containing protein [Saccharospirillum alexandrii]|uniref:sigma-54 interaction domain-containing protein n=1 Tax=Saccharospirillum alexandrii TaxID=2448477 RepID=UPI001C708B3E|nr:sigma-54 dependent transcriptional regulator [Saccharospirillum alexandrii]
MHSTTDEAMHGIVGNCDSLLQTKTIVGRYRSCDASVLILGESGTGKELVARAIHYISDRAEGPFVPVNCGALPDELLENELFGHEQGAFTGARGSVPGLIEQAEGGTLFLDEIGTLSLRGQCALLRFLQSKEFRRLGSRRLQSANVRVFAATNADLNDMVALGGFRQDLLYRLNILRIVLPPLRDRGNDIDLLAGHFIARFCRQYNMPDKQLSAAASQWLYAHDWPGNIRELENLLHRAILSCPGTVIQREDLTPDQDSSITPSMPYTRLNMDLSFQDAKAEVISQFERHYLEALMNRCNGNVSQAARVAGKERRALGKLLKKYGLSR